MGDRGLASIDILDISQRECIGLPFIQRKSEYRSIGSEDEILDTEIDSWNIEVLQEVDLRRVSMFYILRTIEGTTIGIDTLREVELYLTLHIVLRREGLESRCRRHELIELSIFENSIHTIHSGYETETRLIHIIGNLYGHARYLTIFGQRSDSRWGYLSEEPLWRGVHQWWYHISSRLSTECRYTLLWVYPGNLHISSPRVRDSTGTPRRVVDIVAYVLWGISIETIHADIILSLTRNTARSERDILRNITRSEYDIFRKAVGSSFFLVIGISTQGERS